MPPDDEEAADDGDEGDEGGKEDVCVVTAALAFNTEVDHSSVDGYGSLYHSPVYEPQPCSLKDLAALLDCLQWHAL
jgi:hypothetical protein